MLHTLSCWSVEEATMMSTPTPLELTAPFTIIVQASSLVGWEVVSTMVVVSEKESSAKKLDKACAFMVVFGTN